MLVANEGDEDTAAEADEVLWVPDDRTRCFAPVVDVVPAPALRVPHRPSHGHNVDRPRNLAKTVTVE